MSLPGLPMFLYFIRIKDPFVRTFEDKFKGVVGVERIEQVSVIGGPAKAERGFQHVGREHTMLIVRVQGERSVTDIEKIIEAGKTLDAIYQHEQLKLAD